MPLWELVEKGKAWVELYRTAAIAERRAEREIAERNARRQRMRDKLSGRGRAR